MFVHLTPATLVQYTYLCTEGSVPTIPTSADHVVLYEVSHPVITGTGLMVDHAMELLLQQRRGALTGCREKRGNR